MDFLRRYIYFFVQLGVFIATFYTDSYDLLSYILIISVFFSVLDRLGNSIVLRELMSLHICFTCLLMPLMGFNVYNRFNAMAVLWVRYMPVSKDVYFSFILPAVSAYVTILSFPFGNNKVNDHNYLLGNIIPRLKEMLTQKQMGKTGTILMLAGIFMFGISSFLPISLKFVSLLFYFSSFAGLLYVYFAKNYKYRVPVISLFAIFIFASALSSSMFTIVVYMGITLFSLLFLGYKSPFWKKFILFAVIGFSLVVLQSIKPAYRDYTWRSNYKGNRAVLFANLIGERINKGNFFDPNSFFHIYYRTNQGFNIALVMVRIPEIQAHDYGSVLVKNIAASIVPRLLWPDKPEAGGKFNMKYYAGMDIKGWSTNIGPLGEAFGGFGKTGGIFYMAVLGLFVRWVYAKLLRISNRNPIFLLWLPVLFYQSTYSAETDTLQILNSLLKAAFFIWILTKIFPVLFGKKIDKSKIFNSENPEESIKIPQTIPA